MSESSDRREDVSGAWGEGVTIRIPLERNRLKGGSSIGRDPNRNVALGVKAHSKKHKLKLYTPPSGRCAVTSILFTGMVLSNVHSSTPSDDG